MEQSSTAKTKTRRKNYAVWERIVEKNPEYGVAFINFTIRFPMLSPQAVRVAVLVRSFPSWMIGNMLCIAEHTVENLRYEIRKKLGIIHDDKLPGILLAMSLN
jgi:hypothetical protein